MSTITTVSCDPIATSPRSGAKPSAVQDRKRSGKSKARTRRSDRVAGGRKRVDASKRADTGTVASKKTSRSPSSKEHHKVSRSSQSLPPPHSRAKKSAAPAPLQNDLIRSPAYRFAKVDRKKRSFLSDEGDRIRAALFCLEGC